MNNYLINNSTISTLLLVVILLFYLCSVAYNSNNEARNDTTNQINNSTTTSDLYIYATPAMFLLDSEKIMLCKPTTFEEFTSILIKAESDSVVSGKIIPDGKPIDPPIRVKAGDVCIVDLVQNYFVTGSLSGTFSIDYRILVYGPCGEPPGTYSEEWIAYGVFKGKLKETPAFGKFNYIAESKPGGEIVGKMVFNQGMKGNLLIKGNFNDRKLTYNGWLNE